MGRIVLLPGLLDILVPVLQVKMFQGLNLSLDIRGIYSHLLLQTLSPCLAECLCAVWVFVKERVFPLTSLFSLSLYSCHLSSRSTTCLSLWLWLMLCWCSTLRQRSYLKSQEVSVTVKPSSIIFYVVGNIGAL